VKNILLVRIGELCNASCFMCDFAQHKKKRMLSKDEFESIKSYVIKEKCELVRFTGGETLLNDNVAQYINELKQHNCVTSIITNGYYLKDKYKDICENGLDQVIVSLDGDIPEIHNMVRNTEGIYEAAVEGIRLIKRDFSNVVVRVNTVVNKNNYNRLLKLYKLLNQLGVDQWSIIPVKIEAGYWKDIEFNSYKDSYYEFMDNLNLDKPILLGYSKQWAGRDEDEIKEYYTSGKTFTPKHRCNLVKYLRFYNPFDQELVPCNCAVHRLEDYNKNISATQGIEWLFNNIHQYCKGCEPINAYISEHIEELDKDIFSF